MMVAIFRYLVGVLVEQLLPSPFQPHGLIIDLSINQYSMLFEFTNIHYYS